MAKSSEWPAYSATRFKYIGVSKCQIGLWRFVSLDWQGGGTRQDAPGVIGPQYKTKAECLADLERYARDSGYDTPAD